MGERAFAQEHYERALMLYQRKQILMRSNRSLRIRAILCLTSSFGIRLLIPYTGVGYYRAPISACFPAYFYDLHCIEQRSSKAV